MHLLPPNAPDPPPRQLRLDGWPPLRSLLKHYPDISAWKFLLSSLFDPSADLGDLIYFLRRSGALPDTLSALGTLSRTRTCGAFVILPAAAPKPPLPRSLLRRNAVQPYFRIVVLLANLIVVLRKLQKPVARPLDDCCQLIPYLFVSLRCFSRVQRIAGFLQTGPRDTAEISKRDGYIVCTRHQHRAFPSGHPESPHPNNKPSRRPDSTR